jgi:hypothetical protein
MTMLVIASAGFIGINSALDWFDQSNEIGINVQAGAFRKWVEKYFIRRLAAS